MSKSLKIGQSITRINLLKNILRKEGGRIAYITALASLPWKVYYEGRKVADFISKFTKCRRRRRFDFLLRQVIREPLYGVILTIFIYCLNTAYGSYTVKKLHQRKSA